MTNNTPEALAAKIAESKRAVEIAKATGAVASAQLTEMKQRGKVEKIEEKLGKLQEKINAKEEELKDMKKVEATMQAELTAADEALSEAADQVKQAEEDLRAL
jgi:chromosome segregation ATPase